MDEFEPESDESLEDLMRYDQAEWEEWQEIYEGEYKFEIEDEKAVERQGEEEGEEEEEEDEEEEDRSSEESVPDFGAAQVERRKQSFLRRQVEKKTDAFRKLVDASKKKKQADSIETIITLEDEIETLSFGSSSSSHSYPCFKSIDISDSQLKLLNLFNIFPIPDDPGNVRAFWVLYDPIETYTGDSVKKFEDTMKTLNLRPIACMPDLLRSDLINLRYYGLDPRAVKAICEAVCNNTYEQSLDLKDNWLTPEACLHLNDLMMESEILRSINLSGCKIGYEGIKNMLNGITQNWSLVELNLSNCHLGNEGFNSLAPVIEINELLQTLNLTDNQLGTECAQALESMLAHNTHLEHLNLSWNGLFTKEVSNGIFRGLLENKTLLSINLSWNALGKETLAPLSIFLQQNETLEFLYLSGNRFDEQAGSTIGKALAKNIGLRKLYLGNNPLKSTGGFAIIHSLIPELSPNSSLNYVDLENIWVKKEALSDLEKIETGRPWLHVKLGGIFSNYKLVGPDEKKIFFRRAIFEGMKPKKKKQRRDFGHFILSLEDKLNTRENFKGLVKAFKIKLSETLVYALMNAFRGVHKKVDQAAMKDLFLQLYPNTTAPPPASPIKKKKKGEKIGNKKKKKKKSDNRGDSKAEGVKVKTKKGKGKTVMIAKVPLSESGTEEEEFDEFENEEVHGN